MLKQVSQYFTLVGAFSAICLLSCCDEQERTSSRTGPAHMTIDRQALVTRHNPVNRKADPLLPLSVGNGEFAFTVDVTGLQSFPQFYAEGIPLGTQSHWGWHSFPTVHNVGLDDVMVYYNSHGRKVGYPEKKGVPGRDWLRANPHRLHLGRIGAEFLKADGTTADIKDIDDVEQVLDMWTGTLSSRFVIEAIPVKVWTCCHPTLDMIVCRIESPMAAEGRLKVCFEFPYGSAKRSAADWENPDKHTSLIRAESDNRIEITRKLDSDSYFVSIACTDGCSIVRVGTHKFSLHPAEGKGNFDFACAFSGNSSPEKLRDFEKTRSTCRDHWHSYWSNGGVVDLSQNTDARANELERRIVLSQYLTAIQCAGSRPPQESGLTYNSWNGKFHLEMHWWHAAHFALWDRLELLEKSLDWYRTILPKAQQTAARQGYAGARWPKMVGPHGRESPSTIGVFLLWQQPHPIYYAELCYRLHRNRETLEKYKGIVFETAEFMASFAAWDEKNGRYILGPPVIAMSENHIDDKAQAYNPAYALAYWDFGLRVAQKWRQHLGMAPEEKWDYVRRHLSPLPVKDGVYVELESMPDIFVLRNSHPSFLAPMGVLPGDMVDRETMQRTVRKLMQPWEWSMTWSTDFHMLAMTAARLGDRELAVEALMKEARGNRWLANGHCYQDKALPAYLPGNGGLLTAVTMMAAGWDGAPDKHAPGFPQNGNWTVRCEGLKPMP